MFVRRHFLLLVAALAVAVALFKGATVWQRDPSATTPVVPTSDEAFRRYWYTGQAELTSYDLRQVRYGQVNPGEAVLIFVTEDFRTDEQVKLESEDRSKATSILKLNQVRKFKTGIYDYSTMTSVFMPVDLRLFPHALKTTTSVQEWCGHVYAQINLRGREYHLTSHSYFEKEADAEKSFARTWLEDELWTRLRLSPETLPTGELDVVPSLLFSRLGHRELKPEAATATLSDTTMAGANLRMYTLQYPALQRRLALFFEKQSPFALVGWEETAPEKGKLMTTRATRRRTLRNPYWQHNQPADAALRDSLKLQ